MSVLQSKAPELRFARFKDLEQEAKIIGNYYRDIIRAYGIDCTYNKLKLPYPEVFKTVIDQNNLLMHAYGYDDNPNYEISARMITYMEVDSDVLNLNKYGVVPNTDSVFYFDSTDFAAALATKLGQYKEYKILETSVQMEVPDCTSAYTDKIVDGKVVRHYISADTMPYNLGMVYKHHFDSEILSGDLSCELESYELGVEKTIVCDPYNYTQPDISFAANPHIAKSFRHHIDSNDMIDMMLYLTYKVNKVDGKNILSGYTHGAVLFYDLNVVGKYINKISPNVGDVITIDFPNDQSREKYEITDCFDRQLTQDGINPLMHKYVWKCKARRYINSNDNVGLEENEADKRISEKLDLLNTADEQILEKISVYDDDEDAAYGGYERKKTNYDKQIPNDGNTTEYTYIPDGNAITILEFENTSKLLTDGYELYFQNTLGNITKITLVEDELNVKDNYVQTELQYIKASDNFLHFVNFDGKVQRIASDVKADKDTIELCLNSMFDSTIDSKPINKTGDCFFKFRNTRSFMFVTDEHLYFRSATSKTLTKLA